MCSVQYDLWCDISAAKRDLWCGISAAKGSDVESMNK